MTELPAVKRVGHHSESSPATSICICTSYAAKAEPRARRHAAFLARENPDWRVLFIDCIPRGETASPPEEFIGLSNLTYQSCRYPWRGSGRVRRIVDRIRHLAARGVLRLTGLVTADACSSRARYLLRMLRTCKADIYVGYNMDTLIAIGVASAHHDGCSVFDCMEYYSDMGDGQSPLDRRIVEAMESRYLRECRLVTASSGVMAEALRARYGLEHVLPIYNAAPLHTDLPVEKHAAGFCLYWRNAVIGISQRGLGDLLTAMRSLPRDVQLHIRGRLPVDGGRELRRLISEYGLQERVFIHPPHGPNDGVAAASPYTVGVCPEQSGPRNQALTVSNKLFDFFMAGLPVIASDLPGLRSVIERADAGVVFRSADAADLREKVLALYEDRDRLRRLSRNARAFALSEGNFEHEMQKFGSAFCEIVAESRHGTHR